MKKKTIELTDSQLARTTVLVGTSIVGSLIMATAFIILKYVDNGAILKAVLPQNPWAAFFVMLGIFIGIKLLLFKVAIDEGFVARAEARIKKKREDMRTALLQHRQTLLEQRQEKKRLLKEAYGITRIFSGDDPLVFIIELSDDPTLEYQPTVYVNETPISSTRYGKNTLVCYIKKAITAEQETITFRIGANTAEIKNPYYSSPAVSDAPIRWQCEGHGPERRILIPLEYFPYATTHTVYEFSLKVQGKSFGNFKGKRDDATSSILIPLGREIGKRDCINKEVILSLTFGSCNKFTLPKPIVMIKEGVLLS